MTEPDASTRARPAWPSWLPHRVDALSSLSVLRVLAFVALAIADLFVAGLLAIFVAESSDHDVPFVAVMGVLVAIQKPVFDALGRWAVGPRGSLFAWAWLSMLAVPMTLGARAALADAIVMSHLREGAGSIALVIAAPIAIALVGSVGAWWLHALLSRRYAWIDRAFMVGGAVLLFACTAMAAWQVSRAMRLPDAETYIASSPILAHFDGLPPMSTPGPVRSRDHDIEIVRVSHGSNGYEPVSLTVARDGHPASERSPTLIGRGQSFSIVSVAPVHALAVRYDQQFGPYYRGAVDERTGRWIDINAIGVAPVTGAPRGWAFGTLAGFAFVAFILATQRRTRRRTLAEIAAFREGETTLDGVVRFADGSAPSTITPANATLTGTVMARAAGAADPAHYRTDGSHGPVEVIRGTRSELLGAASAMLLGRLMYALAVALITSGPMMAFAWSVVDRTGR